MHNVEGDNNRLTPGLQPMGCVQNGFLFHSYEGNIESCQPDSSLRALARGKAIYPGLII
jgi:hypothetical protein